MSITLTESAVIRLKELASQQPGPQGGLRISVRGGGCSGLSYDLAWAPAPTERDKVFERDGAFVYVDPKSYLYLQGTELTYEQSMTAAMFKLVNPNAKATCGCGESFSV